MCVGNGCGCVCVCVCVWTLPFPLQRVERSVGSLGLLKFVEVSPLFLKVAGERDPAPDHAPLCVRVFERENFPLLS